MKNTIFTCMLVLCAQIVFAQNALQLPVGDLYEQDFNTLDDGLPPGWFVYESSTFDNLGSSTSFINQRHSWVNATGGMKNLASANSLSLGATTTQQNNSADRALGWRLSNTFGDPGAAIVLKLENTLHRESLSFSVDHQNLDPQARGYIVLIQYSINSGVSWTDLGDYTLPANAASSDWGSLNAQYALGTDADNLSSEVWIRFAVLQSSTGSGSRDTYAIDNFSLSWNIANSTCPVNLPPPTALLTDSVGYAEARLNWIGHPCTDQFLVAVAEGNQTLPTLTSPNYQANVHFGLGGDLGGGFFVVYASTFYQTFVRSLQPNVEYTVGVYAYDGQNWTAADSATFTTLAATTHYFTNLGQAFVWDDADNWSGGRVPAIFDTVILDNTHVNGQYTLNLPDRRIDLAALHILPQDSMRLHILASNTFGLHLSAPDTALIIGNRAVLHNEAGAMSGAGIFTTSWVIHGGGKYLHNSNRATASLIASLVKSRADYPSAIWEYGENFSGSPSIVNQRYPSLHIYGTPATFNFSSNNPLTVAGELYIAPSASYTLSIRLHLEGNMQVEGILNFTHTGDYAFLNTGSSLQTISSPGLTTFGQNTKMMLQNTVELGGNIFGDVMELHPAANASTNASAFLQFWRMEMLGDLDHHGHIELPANDTAFGVMIQHQVSGNGSITQSMYLSDFNNTSARWFSIGAASNAAFQTLADSGAHFNYTNASQSVLFEWDALTGDYALPQGNAFVPGRGYFLFAGENQHGIFTRSLPGVLRSTGGISSGLDHNIQLSYGAAQQDITVTGMREGWNLIANPYFASYDWNNQIVPQDIEGTIYVRNEQNTGFTAIGVTETDDSRYIPPMQAFWIRAQTAPTNGFHTLTLTANQRNEHRTHLLKRGSQNHLRFKFLLENESQGADEWVVGFHPLATEAFDAQFDGHKMPNDPNQSAIWADSNAILYLPPLDSSRRIPLKMFAASSGGNHVFKLSDDYGNSAVGLWLEDVYENTIFDLRQGAFSFSPSSNDTLFNRFVLHVGQVNNPLQMDNYDDSRENDMRVWTYQSVLYIDYPFEESTKVELVDLTGKTIKQWALEGAGRYEKHLEVLPKGVYILKTNRKAVRILL
jgi:hypothetical protein